MSKTTSTESRLAKRYANALFTLASEKKALDVVEADLKTVQAVFAASDTLQTIAKNPTVPRSQLFNAMEAILKKTDISEDVRHFTLLLSKKRRLALFSHIVDAFDALLQETRGEVTAEVITASTLSAAHKKAIATNLGKVTKKKVHINARVDKSILGGMIVNVESKMFDDSIRNKLEQLAKTQKVA